MARSHKLQENQVKSKIVVFPKGGDVNAVNGSHQEQLAIRMKIPGRGRPELKGGDM